MLPVVLGDEVFEFTGDGPPSSTLSLHARESGLAAIAESLRERVIVSFDGTERRELEIALQNESEQFLRIDLAHPRNQVTVHQVQVAGRDVRIAWERHDGRDLLLVPLIRTGLLEREVAIRVACVARGSAPGVAGNRELRLPGLRDVPVFQSSMILMVPRDYNWSGIEGTLEQVEVPDLELDETARQALNLKKLAEAIETTKGKVQVQALSKLGALNQAYEQKVTVQKKDVQALSRAEDSSTDQQRLSPAAANEKVRKQVIDEVDMTLCSNVNFVLQTTVNQKQSAVALTVTDLRVDFPRIGETLAFRQQQGIGRVRLDFVAVERVQRRNDMMMALLLITALLAGATLGNSLFRTRRRAALVMALAAGGAMWLGAAVDLAMVVILVAGVLAVLGRGTGETSPPIEATD